MSIFNDSKIVVLLSRDLLVVLTSNDPRPELKFSKDYLRHGELRDKENFEKELLNFLTAINLGQKKIVVLLARDLVFDKMIDQSPNSKLEIESFLSKVPLAQTKIAAKALNFGNKVGVIATNKEIYQSLINCLEQAGCKVLAVVPAILFTDLNPITLDKSNLSKVLSAKSLMEDANLLNQKLLAEDFAETEPDNLEIDKNSVQKSDGHFLWLILAVILVGIIIGGLYYFRTFVLTQVK